MVRRNHLLAALHCTALLATPALAVDGVVEINEARALAGAITPGDTPGFPVTLSRPGSYRLTSRLATSSKSTTGILVTSDDVTLDLNGFAIACAFAVEGGVIPAACLAPLGSGDGVGVDVNTRARTTVRNGVVRNMGRDGVHLGLQARVEQVQTSANGGDGIEVFDQSSVADSKAIGNTGRGIFAGSACKISGSTVYSNGNDGITAGSGCTLRENTARSNEGDGINAGIASTLSDNTAFVNTRNGLWVGAAGVVSRNGVFANRVDGIHAGAGSTISHNTVRESVDDGIEAAGGSTLIGNAVSKNGAFGLNLPPGTTNPGGGDFDDSGYVDNVMIGNNPGFLFPPQVFGGFQLGTNYCSTGPC